MTAPQDGDDSPPSYRPGDATLRDTDREPRPQRPTAYQVWGARALLLLPAAVMVVKLLDLPGQPVAPVTSVAAALGLGTLFLAAIRTWRMATEPRLTYEQSFDVLRGIPRSRRRVLNRALRRGGPLPPELRMDATRYAWASRTGVSTWFVLTGCGANVMPTTSPLYDDVFNLVLGLLLIIATTAFTLLDKSLARRARELDLPLTGPDTGDREQG